MSDLAVMQALSRALGHEPPFTDKEVGGLRGPLVITGARDLAPLTALGALTELTLYACTPEPMPSLAGLTSLRRLRVLGCAVEDLEFLRGCAALEELEVNFGLARDPSPILELPALRSTILVGNPFDREKLKAVAERLQQEPRGAGRPAVVEVPRDGEWRVQDQLRARDLKLGFASVDIHSDDEILVRPGVGAGLLRDKPDQPFPFDDDVDVVETSSLALDVYFKNVPNGATTEQFFSATFMDRPAADRGASRLSMHITVGDAGDAESWIASATAVPESDRAALGRFVTRFPTVRFFREDAALGMRIGAHAGVSLPPWFLALRSRVLAGVEPRRRVLVRFDSFDKPHSPRADYAETIWYELVLRRISDKDVRKMYGDCGAFPIAYWPSEMRSTLVIPLAGDDGRILECAEVDLFDREADGLDPTGSMYVAFDSYASMLGHIVELMIDGEAVKAR